MVRLGSTRGGARARRVESLDEVEWQRQGGYTEHDSVYRGVGLAVPGDSVAGTESAKQDRQTGRGDAVQGSQACIRGSTAQGPERTLFSCVGDHHREPAAGARGPQCAVPVPEPVSAGRQPADDAGQCGVYDGVSCVQEEHATGSGSWAGYGTVWPGWARR